MAQYYKDSKGNLHEFPDDATPEEIDAATRQFDAPQKPKPSASNSDFAAMVSGKKRQPQPNALGFKSRAQGEAYGMGPAYSALDFLDSARHHVGNLAMGTGQLIHKGVTAAADAVLPENNSLRQSIDRIDQKAPRVLAKREADYQARVPDSAASYAGAATGEVLPWMTGIGELRAAGVLPEVAKGTGLLGKAAEYGKKGGLLALEGAAMAVPQPVTGDGSYAQQKAAQVAVGAATAPALGGGVKVFQGLGSLARYATPAGRDAIANERLAKLYGADAEVLARLRADSGVQGLESTPGQVIGTPQAVQAERGLRNNSVTGPAFAQQESANNFAMREQAARVAKDDAALEAARQTRAVNRDAYRARALPEQGSAMVDATGIFNTLQRLTLSANPAVRGAAREHLALLKRQAVDGKVPAYALDDVRQEAGAMIAKHTPQGGNASKEAVRYEPVKNQIADALDRAVPGYRNYLAAYARDSQPINDMEAARKLIDAIDSGRRDAGGNQAVNLSQVKALLSKDNRANFPMSEPARKQIEAVLEALQKRSITDNNLAAAGPGTAADIMRGPIGPQHVRAGGVALSGLLGSTGGGLPLYLGGLAATEVAARANQSVLRNLAEKASSAPRTANALEAYLSKQKPGQTSLLDLLAPYQQRALPK